MSSQTLDLDWPICIRPAIHEDENFILAHWQNAIFSERPWSFMRKRTFTPWQNAVIAGVLHRDGCRCVFSTDSEGVVKHGFLVYEWLGPKLVLHFIFVKKLWRDKHVATRLLEHVGWKRDETPITATCWTRAITPALRKKWGIKEFQLFIPYMEGTQWRERKKKQTGSVVQTEGSPSRSSGSTAPR